MKQEWTHSLVPCRNWSDLVFILQYTNVDSNICLFSNGLKVSGQSGGTSSGLMFKDPCGWCVCVYVMSLSVLGCVRTTWWQLNSFMTEASLRNSILSLMLADSLTVLMATRVSGSSLTTPFARPSYTMPNEPWPSSRLRAIFSRATSHSSGTYTEHKVKRFMY